MLRKREMRIAALALVLALAGAVAPARAATPGGLADWLVRAPGLAALWAWATGWPSPGPLISWKCRCGARRSALPLVPTAQRPRYAQIPT